jgi:hypothetical protein
MYKFWAWRRSRRKLSVACRGIGRACHWLGRAASLPQRPHTQESEEYFLLLDAEPEPRCQLRKRVAAERSRRSVYLGTVRVVGTVTRERHQRRTLACSTTRKPDRHRYSRRAVIGLSAISASDLTPASGKKLQEPCASVNTIALPIHAPRAAHAATRQTRSAHHHAPPQPRQLTPRSRAHAATNRRAAVFATAHIIQTTRPPCLAPVLLCTRPTFRRGQCSSSRQTLRRRP